MWTMSPSNIIDGDDSVVQMVPSNSSKKRPAAANGGVSSKASLGGSSDIGTTSAAADPTTVYLKEIKVVEKGIHELCKEVLSAQTSTARVGEIREQLRAKADQLTAMKGMIERDTR